MRHEFVGYRKSNGFIGKQLSYYVLCRTLWNSFANLLKIKSVFDYVFTALIYGNSELSVFIIIGSMRRPVGCLVKDACQ
jgi:hypothetical protein